MGLQLFDLYPRKCKTCGKPFESRADYAYKMERQKGKPIYWWFCSWHCLQAFREKKGGKAG